VSALGWNGPPRRAQPEPTLKLTVIIPTASRPGLLREALAGIARQTALAEVATVFVSENTSNTESASVCREFSQLPIRYSHRNPSLSPNAHFTTLVGEVETPMAAVLHDDDWWAEHHLASALRALADAPSAAACYSGFFEPYRTAYPLYAESSLACWSATGYPPVTGVWSLSLLQTVLALLPETSLRYSTLVSRTAALKAGRSVFSLGNNFDTDRMLAVALAQQGGILYQPVPSVFIRRHPAQDFRTFDHEAVYGYMSRTTAWMLDAAAAAGADVRAALGTLIDQCPADHRPQLLHKLRRPVCLDVLRAKGCLPGNLREFDEASRRREKFAWVHPLLPPALVDLARKAISPPR
jgi:hypothetical protein